MKALEQGRDHLLAQLAAFDEQRDGAEPAWLASLRRESAASFAEQGLPSPKLEEWRYTNVAPLAGARFALAEPCEPAQEDVESVAFPLFACSLFVFVDGRYAPDLSVSPALAGDLPVESLAALRRQAPERLEPQLGRLARAKEHPFVALATAFLDDGAVLQIPEGHSVQRPLHLVFVSSGAAAPSMRFPRVLIECGAGSRATVIQDFVSLSPDDSGFTDAVTEVTLAPGARLDLVQLQREAPSAFFVSNVQVRQERDSCFASHTVTLGGRLVRNDLAVTLGDTGAECSLFGLFLGQGSQVVDNHTLVDHAMPHGSSSELYKGILRDGARGVFRGRVIVRPDAQRTDARQSNPNLLLSDRAEINTKPQLEIHADDVKCSHGSSIGQLDPDALFYLRSRGMPEDTAREVLTLGFAAEILNALPVDSLAESLGELVADRVTERPGTPGVGS